MKLSLQVHFWPLQWHRPDPADEAMSTVVRAGSADAAQIAIRIRRPGEGVSDRPHFDA